MIAAKTTDGNRFQTTCLSPKKEIKKGMKWYEEFLEFVREHEGYTFLSWSSVKFDRRVIRGGLKRYFPKGVKVWNALEQAGYCTPFRRNLVFPVTDRNIAVITAKKPSPHGSVSMGTKTWSVH